VRAHTGGHVDFTKFDPYDGWAWKKLNLVMQQLEDEQLQQVTDVDFRYYLAMAASKWVTAESGADCVDKAAEHRRKLISAYTPWIAQDNAAENTVETLVDKYHRLIGKAGEPYYDAMVAEMIANRKRTPAEREAYRISQEAAARRAAMSGK
jgi:hypothetical protein